MSKKVYWLLNSHRNELNELKCEDFCPNKLLPDEQDVIDKMSFDKMSRVESSSASPLLRPTVERSA